MPVPFPPSPTTQPRSAAYGAGTLAKVDSMVFDNAADNTQMVERVAAEFNQLNFYVSQCADLPFVRQAAKVCIHVCASLACAAPSST